jgi:hypothetical protein
MSALCPSSVGGTCQLILLDWTMLVPRKVWHTSTTHARPRDHSRASHVSLIS